MPEQHRVRGEAALNQLRARIAQAMTVLGVAEQNPRHVEAIIRLNPFYNSITTLENMKRFELEREVSDAIRMMDEKWQPALYDAWAAQFEIPEYAYVELLGGNDVPPLGPIGQRCWNEHLAKVAQAEKAEKLLGKGFRGLS